MDARRSILVVEDEEHTRELIGSTLAGVGYGVKAVEDGESAVLAVVARAPDMIVLDVRLPGIDGWEVCRRVRDSTNVPILFLTGLDDEASTVRGFRLGADDYLGKPFSPEVLRARVAAILRRSGAADGTASPTVHLGDVRLDLASAEVRRGDAPIHLTATEYRLLAVLAQSANRVVSPRDLVRQAQGYEVTPEEAGALAKVHISHIRQKIEPAPPHPRYLLSVRGLGYMLRTDAIFTEP